MDLKFSYDERRDILTIEGVEYAGDMFRTLGFAPIGSTLKLVQRENGVITLQEVEV